MCTLPEVDLPISPFPTPACPAKALGPSQRQGLALAALAGTLPITALAAQHQVSRKFVCRTAGHAENALRRAFEPDLAADDHVLFHLPVTEAWLCQLVLALVLICHCSLRGRARRSARTGSGRKSRCWRTVAERRETGAA